VDPLALPQLIAFEPWLAATVLLSLALYLRGVRILWRKAGRGRGIRFAHVARFGAGWVVLAAALLSPLDALAERSFAFHMVQHELLMVVAAPLLVTGRPLEAWAWAAGPAVDRALGGFARNVAGAFGWMLAPVGAWCVHFVALWLWHMPALFDAALADNGVHILQHVSFFASALAFWWSIFRRGAQSLAPSAMMSVLTTMLHTSALGALLTFSGSAWYASGAGNPLGLGALEDQQAGGLVMWVPGGLAYLAAGLAIAACWLRAVPRPPLRTAD
jgi:putative membrane protein